MLDGWRIKGVRIDQDNLVLEGLLEPNRISISECSVEFRRLMHRERGKLIRPKESRCVVLIRPEGKLPILEFLNRDRTKVGFPDRLFGFKSGRYKRGQVILAIRSLGCRTWDLD